MKKKLSQVKDQLLFEISISLFLSKIWKTYENLCFIVINSKQSSETIHVNKINHKTVPRCSMNQFGFKLQ